jgi:hypothetical protein
MPKDYKNIQELLTKLSRQLEQSSKMLGRVHRKKPRTNVTVFTKKRYGKPDVKTPSEPLEEGVQTYLTNPAFLAYLENQGLQICKKPILESPRNRTQSENHILEDIIPVNLKRSVSSGYQDENNLKSPEYFHEEKLKLNALFDNIERVRKEVAFADLKLKMIIVKLNFKNKKIADLYIKGQPATMETPMSIVDPLNADVVSEIYNHTTELGNFVKSSKFTDKSYYKLNNSSKDLLPNLEPEINHDLINKPLKLIIKTTENPVNLSSTYGDFPFREFFSDLFRNKDIGFKIKCYRDTAAYLKLGQSDYFTKSDFIDNSARNDFLDFVKQNGLPLHCDIPLEVEKNFNYLRNVKVFTVEDLLKNRSYITSTFNNAPEIKTGIVNMIGNAAGISGVNAQQILETASPIVKGLIGFPL